jgi:hypothetical protein
MVRGDAGILQAKRQGEVRPPDAVTVPVYKPPTRTAAFDYRCGNGARHAPDTRAVPTGMDMVPVRVRERHSDPRIRRSKDPPCTRCGRDDIQASLMLARGRAFASRH